MALPEVTFRPRRSLSAGLQPASASATSFELVVHNCFLRLPFSRASAGFLLPLEFKQSECFHSKQRLGIGSFHSGKEQVQWQVTSFMRFIFI